MSTYLPIAPARTTPDTPRPVFMATLRASSDRDLSGSELVDLDDQSTQYTDHDSKFEITLPNGWLTLRLNQQEYFRVWANQAQSNAQLEHALTSIQNDDPNQFRLFAFDLKPDHHDDQFLTNINVTWFPDENRALQDYLQANVGDLRELAMHLDSIDSNITETSSGLTVGVIQMHWDTKTDDGYNLYQEMYFQLMNGYVIITFSTNESLESQAAPDVQTAISSVKLLSR